jgi:hypothetical protein
MALQQGTERQWQRAFEQLDSPRQLALLQQSMPEPVGSLISLSLECYYRDYGIMGSVGMGSVGMDSVGMDERPAFPQGFELEAKDWPLLDPVKKRAPFYRRV